MMMSKNSEQHLNKQNQQQQQQKIQEVQVLKSNDVCECETGPVKKKINIDSLSLVFGSFSLQTKTVQCLIYSFSIETMALVTYFITILFTTQNILLCFIKKR